MVVFVMLRVLMTQRVPHPPGDLRRPASVQLRPLAGTLGAARLGHQQHPQPS